MGGWLGRAVGVAWSGPNRPFGIRNLSFGIRMRCKNGDSFVIASEELEKQHVAHANKEQASICFHSIQQIQAFSRIRVFDYSQVDIESVYRVRRLMTRRALSCICSLE